MKLYRIIDTTNGKIVRYVEAKTIRGARKGLGPQEGVSLHMGAKEFEAYTGDLAASQEEMGRSYE